MAETILVTGAMGKIGQKLTKLLAQDANVRVRAAVRNAAKAHELEEAGAHLVEVDLENEGTVEPAVAGVDKLFLLTAPNLTMSLQASNILNAAEAAGVKTIVKLSVIGAELEPGITLTRMHRSVELSIMGSGIDWTFLRPNGFMQNLENSAKSIKEQGAFYLPMADAKLSMIDVDDIAEVAAKILLDTTNQHSGRAYDLTGPEAIDSNQVAGFFSDALEKPVTYVPVHDQAARDSMSGMGMSSPLVEALIELYELERTNAFAPVSNNVETILGRPATSFVQYLAKNIDKYR